MKIYEVGLVYEYELDGQTVLILEDENFLENAKKFLRWCVRDELDFIEEMYDMNKESWRDNKDMLLHLTEEYTAVKTQISEAKEVLYSAKNLDDLKTISISRISKVVVIWERKIYTGD